MDYTLGEVWEHRFLDDLISGICGKVSVLGVGSFFKFVPWPTVLFFFYREVNNFFIYY